MHTGYKEKTKIKENLFFPTSNNETNTDTTLIINELKLTKK